MSILEMKHIEFYYGKKNKKHKILEQADYAFEAGKMYAVLGKSGSGKSTTLALLGALEEPKEGEILYEGENIKKIGYQKYRNQKTSIIFQNYNLLPYLTGYENVQLAVGITKNQVNQDEEAIFSLLDQVGISKSTAQQLSNHLSGGEQQRIAIARTLATDAQVILADEPTGNLDEDTAEEIIELLYRLAHEEDKCVIAVTHTKALAERADVVVRLEESKLI